MGYPCFYPYARSMEWYLRDPAERGEMLAEHGAMGREFPDVLANTVSRLRSRRLWVHPDIRGRRSAPAGRSDALPPPSAGATAYPGSRRRSSPAPVGPSRTSSTHCRERPPGWALSACLSSSGLRSRRTGYCRSPSRASVSPISTLRRGRPLKLTAQTGPADRDRAADRSGYGARCAVRVGTRRQQAAV